jgi:hypothetical protein
VSGPCLIFTDILFFFLYYSMLVTLMLTNFSLGTEGTTEWGGGGGSRMGGPLLLFQCSLWARHKQLGNEKRVGPFHYFIPSTSFPLPAVPGTNVYWVLRQNVA